METVNVIFPYMKEIIIGVIGTFIGYGIKYFWDKRYKRRVRAKEKLKNAVQILNKGRILLSFIRTIDFEKEDLNKVEEFLNIFKVNQTTKEISDKLSELNIYNDIQPYIADNIWNFFYAYLTIISNAGVFLSIIPLGFKSVIRKDAIKKQIIKYVIPVIPEKENFIREDYIKRMFSAEVEGLIREKLLNAIENLK